jgi:[1-hydroxy-2-(trimethylamino)ethyl]phosphonate dioxygenase
MQPMQILSSLDEIERLYAARGEGTYGEGVTQLEHAVQCASLAEADGHPSSLIVAALLHDIGHLLEDEKDVTQADTDLRHEMAGARILSALFGEEVCVPIARHVAAKRYLCFADPQYFQTLSAASQASLVLQGGPFLAREAEAFERLSHWREAVALRRFDDMGKREEHSHRAFSDFLPHIHKVLTARPKA